LLWVSKMADDPITAHLREQVETARAEFESSKRSLTDACKVVPDIGRLNPDGNLMWRRATERYNHAVHKYKDALDQFSEFLIGPKKR